ncbi:MAG: hypothetical protein Q7T54_06045 [Candidatus Levybacteria bacterium]|nr:hypothetical protein [Candidatus Levybacteria bacterium]
MICLIFAFVAQVEISRFVVNSHFELQAKSFAELRIEIQNPPTWLNDLAYFNGRYYNPFGILPSLLLTPFYLLGVPLSQQTLPIVAFPITFLLIYKISRTLEVKRETDALWIAVFFTIGTIYLFLTLTNISAYLVQVVSTPLILAALFEYFTKKRYFLIGCFLGAALLTRSVLIFPVVFFIVEILLNHGKDYNMAFKKILLLCIPIFACLLISGIYNFLRFESITDNGYDHNYSHAADLKIAREYGFFSVQHIPGNLYLLLFKGPDPVKKDAVSFVLTSPFLKIDYWGLGIFFTSPVFFYLLLVSRKQKYVISVCITILIMLFPILTFYAYGAWQYGYRHAFDLYPFLLILLISVFKESFPVRAKLLIMYGIIFNLLFMYSIWNSYPLFVL